MKKYRLPKPVPLYKHPVLWSGVAALAAFLILAAAVQRQATQSWDEWLLYGIHDSFLYSVENIFVVVTACGGALFVSLAACLWAALLLKRQKPSLAYFILLGVGGAAVIGTGLKSIFERPRPELWSWAVTETSFSFPSAHAIASSALALAVIMIAWKTHWYRRITLAGITYLFIIGLSRLVLGVHYPSDIIGGWLVGIMWVCIAWLITIHTWPTLEKRHMKRRVK